MRMNEVYIICLIHPEVVFYVCMLSYSVGCLESIRLDSRSTLDLQGTDVVKATLHGVLA